MSAPRALITLLAALALVLATASAASAEPVPLDAYRRALEEARRQVLAAREASGEVRARLVGQAVATLDAVSEVRVDGAIYPALPHGVVRALISRGEDASLALAAASLEETVRALDRAASAAVADPQRARRLLEAVFEGGDFVRVPDWRDVVAELLRRVATALFPDLRAPVVDRVLVLAVLVPVALALLVLVLWVSGAGLRERVRRETELRASGERPSSAARAHRAAAAEAVRGGRARDAVRELFLFALFALEERGVLRFDPALTDREVLARAAGLPSARELADLVAVYERAWYGAREPTADEVARAEALAGRIAA